MKHTMFNHRRSFSIYILCLIAATFFGCKYETGQTDVSATPSPTINTGNPGSRYETYLEDKVSFRVVHISDGDTIVVEDKDGKRTTVRMHAIDAPELSQSFGRESREQLRALIDNQRVEIREKNRDQFKRVVGQVFFEGKDVGLEMVRGGYVWHFKQYERQQSAGDRKMYNDAEQAARSSRLGLWRENNPTNPQNYRRQNGTRDQR